FSNNREIPIALYAEIALRSASGLNELYECSSLAAAEALAEGFRGLKAPIPAPLEKPASDGSSTTVPAPSIPEALSAEAFSRRRSEVLARASAAAKMAESWAAPPAPTDGGNGAAPLPSALGPDVPPMPVRRSRVPLLVFGVGTALALVGTGIHLLGRHPTN